MGVGWFDVSPSRAPHRYLCPTEEFPTNAPIAPFDSCAGITCSGHGECIDGLCNCEPGWFEQNCTKIPIQLTILRNVSECGGPPLLKPTPPGEQFVDCVDPGLAKTGRTAVQIKILATPVSGVTCEITSQTPQEAAVLQGVGRFDRDSVIGSVSALTVEGVKDLSSNDAAPFTISARCESSGILVMAY